MKPANAPETAIPIPPGGLQPQEPINQIAGIQRVVAVLNTMVSTNFAAVCSNWLTANAHSREEGLPLRDKPIPPMIQTVVTGPDTEVQSGIVWLWITVEAMPPCPDLPSLPPLPSPGHIHIGRLIFDNWYAAGQDDSYPFSGPPVTATTDEGVSGTFVRYPAPVGNGWWKKVA